MAAGGRPGKRLGLLPLIARHEDLVEADFARFYPGECYADRYRRDARGRPRLSTRRLLLLVDSLPMESLFRSECAERYPMTLEQLALYDVYHALTGKKHGYPTALKEERARERKAVLIASRKRSRAAQNRAYMARTAARGN